MPVNGRDVVTLRVAPIPLERPVLLHELLHAFHKHRLGRTPAILQGFQKARRSAALGGKYPDAHFLDSPGEFFAVVGSIYLHGPIEQPPFDCRAIRQEQPEFLAFLAQHFGERNC